jgi:hypothetical protein
MIEETKPRREGKVYELKKSAVRAAREDGLEEGQFTVKQTNKGFAYEKSGSKKNGEEKVKAAPPKPKVEDKPKAEVKKSVKKKDPIQEQLDKDLTEASEARKAERARIAAETPPIPEVTTKVPVPEVRTKSATSTEGGPPPMRTAVAERVKVVNDGKLHKSLLESPTKRVWSIAEELVAANPAITRKQVIAECERLGIAYYTARTQYQQWLTTLRESKANAGKVHVKEK